MQDRFGKNIDGISNKKLFLFDMDGTIYEENRLFEGVIEFFTKTFKHLISPFSFGAIQRIFSAKACAAR